MLNKQVSVSSEHCSRVLFDNLTMGAGVSARSPRNDNLLFYTTCREHVDQDKLSNGCNKIETCAESVNKERATDRQQTRGDIMETLAGWVFPCVRGAPRSDRNLLRRQCTGSFSGLRASWFPAAVNDTPSAQYQLNSASSAGSWHDKRLLGKH